MTIACIIHLRVNSMSSRATMLILWFREWGWAQGAGWAGNKVWPETKVGPENRVGHPYAFIHFICASDRQDPTHIVPDKVKNRNDVELQKNSCVLHRQFDSNPTQYSKSALGPSRYVHKHKYIYLYITQNDLAPSCLVLFSEICCAELFTVQPTSE